MLDFLRKNKRNHFSSEGGSQDSNALIKITEPSQSFIYEPTKKDIANHNTAYFEHGVLVDVSPRNTAISLDEDRDVAYQARYIVSDGVQYDLCNPKDVIAFVIPEFEAQTSETSINSSKNHVETKAVFINVTRDLSYIMKIIAQQVYQNGLAIPMVYTTVNLMLASPVDWSDKDYDRMISQLERLEEYQYAKKLREGIIRIKPEIFDADLRDSTIMNVRLQHAALFNSDLLEMPYLGCACAECAKYQGRVYSISGSDKRFPKLPDFLKRTGKVHPGCRHYFCSYNIERPITKYIRDDNGEVITVQVDAIQNSNRPFIDDRTPWEISAYEEVLKRDERKKNAGWDEESTRKYAKRRIEFEWITEHLPDIAPKSLNAYTRMKRIHSEKYIHIKKEAEKLGMVLDDDL